MCGHFWGVLPKLLGHIYSNFSLHNLAEVKKETLGMCIAYSISLWRPVRSGVGLQPSMLPLTACPPFLYSPTFCMLSPSSFANTNGFCPCKPEPPRILMPSLSLPELLRMIGKTSSCSLLLPSLIVKQKINKSFSITSMSPFLQLNWKFYVCRFAFDICT